MVCLTTPGPTPAQLTLIQLTVLVLPTVMQPTPVQSTPIQPADVVAVVASSLALVIDRCPFALQKVKARLKTARERDTSKEQNCSRVLTEDHPLSVLSDRYLVFSSLSGLLRTTRMLTDHGVGSGPQASGRQGGSSLVDRDQTGCENAHSAKLKVSVFVSNKPDLTKRRRNMASESTTGGLPKGG